MKNLLAIIFVVALTFGCCNREQVVMEKPWTILNETVYEHTPGYEPRMVYEYQDKNGKRGSFMVRGDIYNPGDVIK